MNQIAINSKLSLFNLNVGYIITCTHSNFGNALKRELDLNMFLSFHCIYRISQYWWKKKKKPKISWTQEGIIISRHHRESKISKCLYLEKVLSKEEII
jgi:hypothetical protein